MNRFASITRTHHPDGWGVVDAIDEHGKAWWLVVGHEYAPQGWTELQPLPEPTTEESSPAQINDLQQQVQHLEAMRETEKAALLDALRQIEELNQRIGLQYMKIRRLQDAMAGMNMEKTDDN